MENVVLFVYAVFSLLALALMLTGIAKDGRHGRHLACWGGAVATIAFVLIAIHEIIW